MDYLAKINRKIGKKRLFYVCRDVERAMSGLLLDLPNFFVITNDSSYARELRREHQNILTIKHQTPLDTRELLDRSTDIKKGDLVMVFKPTTQIEKICAQNGWRLLNPSAALANRVEEKISQIKWLGSLKKFLPGYEIKKIKDIKFSGTPFIIQFAHSHTGSGTILIRAQKQLDELKTKFPDRPARVARYIAGPLFTNNNIVWGKNILVGNINYQITGLKPFTDLPFATIGNDWSLPRQVLTAGQIQQYRNIAMSVGKKLAHAGWKGLFGIDVVADEDTGRLYLLEINARQPASATFESELQNLSDKKNLTTFAAHLAALIGAGYDGEILTAIDDGAQIITRVGSRGKNLKKYWRMIRYDNTEPGADQTRFQFLHGIMKSHNRLKI